MWPNAKEVWLVGKGPSLDNYDWSKAGPRLCINETVFVTPDPTAAIAIDYAVLDKYKDLEIPVFKKVTHKHYSFKNEITWGKDDLPFGEVATAPAAVQLLYNRGARKIYFVGFDSLIGDMSYSQKITDIDAKGTSRDNYRRINNALVAIISELKMEAAWTGL